MPDYYPSMGEAVAAAMQHNIRLAYGGRPSDGDRPLPVRYLPSPSADPYSVPGMIVRLTEKTPPAEVAAILEEVNGALTGAMPQLIELVAAAADWTRVRLNFDRPERNPVFDAWTRLAAAHVMLCDAQEQLKAAEDLVTECPTALSDPRHHKRVHELRTRDLLHDVLGDGAAAGPADPAVRTAESARERVARTASPQVAAQPPPPPPPRTTVPCGTASSRRSPRSPPDPLTMICSDLPAEELPR